MFYLLSWRPWAAIGRRIPAGGGRETYLSYYGPLSLLLLLVAWAVTLLFGFALLQWSVGSSVSAPEGAADFGTDLYLSGTTFFTLGLGDVVPRTPLARAFVVAEVGMGFAFLALVIGYLPILYQTFSARETNVSLLDERAGTPPTAAELLRRNVCDGRLDLVEGFLRDWEHWAASLLESHLSYPVLAYYRSQHERQSWVGALTVVLDACALVMAVGTKHQARQARLTFAIARHAAGDLSQVFGTPPHVAARDRLPPQDVARVWDILDSVGVPRPPADAVRALAKLREDYEPYVAALADYLLVDLPPWLPAPDAHDNWEITAWGILPHEEADAQADSADGADGVVATPAHAPPAHAQQ
jgi:hypothetical protein